jgi:hypothetical protein
VIIMEFYPLPETVKRRPARIPRLDRGAVSGFYFYALVRLSMNGAEVFSAAGLDVEPANTVGAPLLDLAAYGFLALKTAIRQGTAIYRWPDSGGQLVFRAHEGEIEVSTNFSRVVGHGRADELVQAWGEFIASVRVYLTRAIPELHKHPYWGRWLRGLDLEVIRGKPKQ